jgi:hypothetical protein
MVQSVTSQICGPAHLQGWQLRDVVTLELDQPGVGGVAQPKALAL